MSKNCQAPALDRYLLVVTDGNDNASKITKDETIKAANNASVAVCTIGIISKDLLEKPLQDVAVGCSYRTAKDVGTAGVLLQEILYNTGNSYRITANPFTCPGPVTLAVRGASLEVCP